MKRLLDENNERCYIHGKRTIATCSTCGRGMCKKCLTLREGWHSKNCPTCRLNELGSMSSSRSGQLFLYILALIVLFAVAIIFTPFYVNAIMQMVQQGATFGDIFLSPANPILLIICYVLIIFFIVKANAVRKSKKYYDKEIDDLNNLL